MSGINQIVLLLNSDHFEAALRDLGGPNSISAYDISKVLGSSLELCHAPTDEELITALFPVHISSHLQKQIFQKIQVTNPDHKNKMD
jgi:hypothetical protein